MSKGDDLAPVVQRNIDALGARLGPDVEPRAYMAVGGAEEVLQMVKVLAAVLTDGLPAVEAACAQALAEGIHSADFILNILARRREIRVGHTWLSLTRILS